MQFKISHGSKKWRKCFVAANFCFTFAPARGNGTLTEWLGNGLQNRLQQFESARYLHIKSQMSYC